jgi:fibronectin-binding autotransporter adhesin
MTAGGDTSGIRGFRTRCLFAGVSSVALMIVGVLISPAQASNYVASNSAELRQAILDASTDPDPNATITLTQSIALTDSTLFAALNGKNITIDTAGFTLSGHDVAAGDTPPGSIGFPAGTGSVTIIGNLIGGNAASDPNAARGGTGLAGEGISITNNGSITGGAGGGHPTNGNAGAGGTGVDLKNGTLINNNVIKGGLNGDSVTGGPMLDGPGGIGVRLEGGTGHVNNGTIQGGDIVGTARGDQGLHLRSATLTNNGTIRGGGQNSSAPGSNADGVYLYDSSTIINNSTGVIRGTDAPGTQVDGDGISFFAGDNTIINRGLISGGGDGVTSGSGNYGIVFASPTLSTGTITVVNSGTIRGNGNTTRDQAIRVNRATLVLELQAGSVIEGNVLANSSGTNDILRLGGAADDTFDVSAIGAAAQYRDFNIFEKTGASTWTITGQATEASPWNIKAGTLLVSAGADTGDGPIDIEGGILAGAGTVGATRHRVGGGIAPGVNGIGTLTVDGNYTGEGGLLSIETVLGGDGSATDRLIVNGGTSGNTQVVVSNLGGAGAQTQEGIKIVDVGGTSDGVFSLIGQAVVNGEQAVLGGAYAYSLHQGSFSDPDDGDWYLRSIGFSPTATAYESYPGVLLGLIDMPTLQQRIGNSYLPNAGSRTDGFTAPQPAADVPGQAPPANLWTRIEGAFGHYEGNSDTGTEYDLDRYRVQVGIDGRLSEADSGILIAGINAQYGRANADLSSDSGDGDNATDSYGGGLTLTWIGASGFYADAQAMAHYLESDLTSAAVGDLVSDNAGWGYGLSLELGKKLAFAEAVSITPQAQLAYSSVDFDDFTDPLGVEVSQEDGESLKGRLGLALGYESRDAGDTRGYVYTIANLTYEFLDAQSVAVAGVEVEYRPDDFGGELGFGGSYEWSGGAYAVHGEALGQSSFEGSFGVKASAGIAARF